MLTPTARAAEVVRAMVLPVADMCDFSPDLDSPPGRVARLPAKAFRRLAPIGLGARPAGDDRGQSAADRAADPTGGVRVLALRGLRAQTARVGLWGRRRTGREQLAA